jgi:hypothetical protein
MTIIKTTVIAAIAAFAVIVGIESYYSPNTLQVTNFSCMLSATSRHC